MSHESQGSGFLSVFATALGALIGAALIGGVTWLLTVEMTLGLPSQTRIVTWAPVTLFAAFCGLLVGTVIARAALGHRDHLPLFAGLASALGAGIAGLAIAVVITAAYLGTYGHPPPDIGGLILYVLAFPAFALLGWFSGFVLGLLVGLGAGFLLSLAFGDRL